MKTGLGICGLIVLTVLPVDGEGPMRVTVTLIHSFAPATVTIRASIEPSAETGCSPSSPMATTSTAVRDSVRRRSRTKDRGSAFLESSRR